MTRQEQTPINVRMSLEDGRFVLRFDEPISGLSMTASEAEQLRAAIASGADRERAITGEPVALTDERIDELSGPFLGYGSLDSETRKTVRKIARAIEAECRAAPIAGEISRDVAAEGGGPAPVQSMRDTQPGGIFVRTVESVAEHYRCSAESAQRYIDLREEGHGQYQALLMAGLADPHDGSAA